MMNEYCRSQLEEHRAREKLSAQFGEKVHYHLYILTGVYIFMHAIYLIT